MIALALAFGEAVVEKGGGDPIFGWSFWEWVIVAVVFIAVVVGVSWALRKFGIL